MMIRASGSSSCRLSTLVETLRVGGALLEPLVLAHGLVVEVLAVDDEHDLVDVRQPARELGGLEARQRLARAGGVPDVAAGCDRAELPVVGRGLDPLQDPLGRRDLVRPHHQQLAVGVEDAVPRQDAEQRVLGEERLREAGQVGDRLVAARRPTSS